MITRRFPVAGGTPWDDLLKDRPWFDPAVEADRRQDTIAADAEAALTAALPTAAAVALERFGHVDLVALEASTPAPYPIRPRFLVRPLWLHNDELSRRRRQHVLLDALGHGQVTIARDRRRTG